MLLLENYARFLGAYWGLTGFFLVWPLVASIFVWLCERNGKKLGFVALYVGFATYLGGIPVPGEIVPATVCGRSVLVFNRTLGIFAFGYLLAAFVHALNQPPGLPNFN